MQDTQFCCKFLIQIVDVTAAFTMGEGQLLALNKELQELLLLPLPWVKAAVQNLLN